MLKQVASVFAVPSLILAAVWPGKGRRERMKAFARQPIAHRGFHDNKGPAPENSMAAYRKAVERGYGIELDVRESADGKLFCMHDRNLLRACGVDRKADQLTWRQLRKLRLFSSEERIPLLRDVLAMVDGSVPIIMEVKAENLQMARSVSRKAARLLDAYEGEVCMESFHPAAVFWFRMNRPEIPRGQLSERFRGYAFPFAAGTFFLSFCAFNFLTKPDFIAYNVTHRGLLRFRLQHSLFHAVCAAWTVKSEEEMKQAASAFDIIIFEGFEPPLTRSCGS